MKTPDDDCADPRFAHDMLAAMIMLHERKNGKRTSYEGASKVALALIREEKELPLHELEPKEEA